MKLVKIGPEKKTFKEYRILYLDIAQWQGEITGDEILIVTKKFYFIENFSQ